MINNIYIKPGRAISRSKPAFAMLCYDGKPITSDAALRVYIRWVHSDYYGTVKDILVKPGDVVMAEEWLALVDEGALETVEEEDLEDLIAAYHDY